MKEYYVIYESYTEYNQFEGSWNIDFEGFDNLEKAKEFMKVESVWKRTLIGPLQLIKT